MENLSEQQAFLEANGFALIDDVFTPGEVNGLIKIIDAANAANPNFRMMGGLFAIRQFFKEVPAIVPAVFTAKLLQIVNRLFGDGWFVVKSIYFDKPGASNWFVAYHQDLTISVKEKYETEGFVNWIVKQNQYAVQPPAAVLQDNFTLRIHLDDTNEQNGALKVIAGSHKQGVITLSAYDFSTAHETICSLKKGGLMIMRPLLLHASGRTVNNKQRRVIHIECSKAMLPQPLQWSEQMEVAMPG